ncbi:hypothetical protein [Chryseobacterium sp. MFBS3-17]|uniref:hypothetical protein n=1 Tax=Chryseobacterium sp. MFBS3-17 TaxID=2886689 RepID=UPI001D0DF5A5|nr:hypothetical protein [Chryseobacterium sp. MFBS3-17]MCC2589350.1 hypothetical protein [Chryseobacterium sp. MFBS3-17]
MATGKNSPPKGVVILFILIILMVVMYFVFQAVFPDLFEGLNTGEAQPVTPE